MRFLLVNPFYPVSENPSPPLGLAYLAAALRRAGIDVRVLDLVVFPYSREYLAEVIEDFRPHVVGATAVTMSIDEAARVVGDVKSIDPGIFTVMGGPHVSFRARESLEEFTALDACVLGEGEEAVVELCRAVEQGGGFEDVRGLVYREGGEIKAAAPREPGIDVDSLPLPARDLLPLGRYRALGLAISMTTSRGCPFQCIFCVGRKMVGANVRYRRPKAVVDELEYLAGLGFPQVNVADDLFTANKKHCLGVCDEILARGLTVKWTSFARVDTVSPEVLHKMKEAGCSAVSFGVETGNPEIMKTIKKGITLDQVVDAVQMCVDADIIPHASFILGLPGETPETIKETVAFGDRLKEMGVSHGFHLLAPFPGTLVRENAAGYGLNILTDDWTEYHANRAIVSTAEATPDMLNEVVLAWEHDFDAYLGDLKERYQAGQADFDEAWPLINLERTVLMYDLMMARVVEEVGTWNGSPTEADPLETLIARVVDRTGGDRGLAAETLAAARDKGGLRLTADNGTLSWSWVDYLD